MALPEFAADVVSVVVKGAFNPAIFSPAWLLLQGLIGATEHAASETEIISRDVTVFTSKWLQCQVTRDSLQVSTDDPTEFERTRDAAVGILRALEHTPIMLMGINRKITFTMGSARKWHTIGDTLAPKKAWDGILGLVGLSNLSVQGVRPDRYDGRIVVQVVPLIQPEWGVLVAHNEHFALATVDAQPTSRDVPFGQPDIAAELTAAKIPVAIQILTEQWEPSMKRAISVVERVAQLGERKK